MIYIEWILLLYAIYFVSYSLISSIAALFYRKFLSKESTGFKSFLVLVPGYKEDEVIVHTVAENLKQDYPKSNFDLVVLADSFEKSTLDKLGKTDCKVLEVSFDRSTKVKSIKEAFSLITDKFDYLVILDADNVMESDYLKKVNAYVEDHPIQALQTQRVAKNKNNSLAILDGISEAINNHIYRQGSHTLGLSVALNGSGMIFKADTFKEVFEPLDSVGGFDRELEYKYLEAGHRVRYFKEAKVLDQKTDSHDNFKNQRKRWISSQYVYLLRFLIPGLKGLLKGKIAYFNSTVWRNIQLPRLINLGLLTIIVFLAIVFNGYLTYGWVIWLGLWLLNAFSMFIAIPREYYNKDLLKSILQIPKIFLSMVLLLFKLKGANKKFIHTKHKTVS